MGVNFALHQCFLAFLYLFRRFCVCIDGVCLFVEAAYFEIMFLVIGKFPAGTERFATKLSSE